MKTLLFVLLSLFVTGCATGGGYGGYVELPDRLAATNAANNQMFANNAAAMNAQLNTMAIENAATTAAINNRRW